ncbi:MAG: hypothetical protein UV71_C0012G0023 [Microgenomates group bacterium GW2011_GWC1_43_13]|uniref:YggT family protein n=2 Tax=Candidatus Woeseibacteriota TaxID=1752722 RepID=A0A837IDH0_9BACT|nr:MAG: hypothetical protein UV71_C0012G0023 [Microgenomates group bacterium GW2011_GWC1_43_13]KKT33100.1 MAG: hypothetical protein UW20_C0005G0032 [Candidatus Woesebacteria bacterium GW2011_GWB1_44_11]KKT54762.1 MAG: hypothetical protein UW47_C0003G0031 [Candidatus Woesebacteria bacterium GW2011_GWA1_44_23]
MAEIVRETVRTENNETVAPAKAEVSSNQTVERLVYFLFGILEVLLIFRLIFKLAGASQGSTFVSLIYTLTGIFIIPFRGIFRQATATGVETTAILEPATLVAVIVYAVLAWGIVALIRILSRERAE